MVRYFLFFVCWASFLLSGCAVSSPAQTKCDARLLSRSPDFGVASDQIATCKELNGILLKNAAPADLSCRTGTVDRDRAALLATTYFVANGDFTSATACASAAAVNPPTNMFSEKLVKAATIFAPRVSEPLAILPSRADEGPLDCPPRPKALLPATALRIGTSCYQVAFDTGASFSQISITGDGQGANVRAVASRGMVADLVELTNVSVKNVPVDVPNDARRAILERMNLDGVIGLTALRPFVLRWSRRDLAFDVRPAAPETPTSADAPLSFDGLRLQIPLETASGDFVTCALDTAAASSVVSRDVMAEIGMAVPTFEGKVSVLAYARAAKLTVPTFAPFELKVAGRRLNIKHAREPFPGDIGCVLGLRDLAQHDFEIDITARQFRWLDR